MNKGILFIISSPSGGGKSTILRKVLAELPGLAFSISHTTRQPRPGEIDGREYHFVTPGEFAVIRDCIPSGFLEWAEVHGNFYGTSRREVEMKLAEGIDVILDIDVQGARQVGQAWPGCVSIFIAPPSLAELERRLRQRGTESEEVLALRLDNSARELAAADEYTYCIVNEVLQDAVESLRAVIIAERSRCRRLLTGLPARFDR